MWQERGSNACGNVSHAGGKAYLHVAAELKGPVHDGISARRTDMLLSIKLWAWGTANTARDKRDAMTAVVIHNSLPSEKPG